MAIHVWLVLLPALILLCLFSDQNDFLTATNGLSFGVGLAASAASGRIVAFIVVIALTIIGLLIR
jgi:hypothetical protein